jgi:hypothetical protein
VLPHLKRQIAGVLAETDQTGNSVISFALQRHHSLAGQIDRGGTRRDVDLALPADLREAIVLNNECAIFNWRAAIAVAHKTSSSRFIDGFEL